MTEDQKEALRLAGIMADEAIRLVGGEGLNYMAAGCLIWQVSGFADRLRVAAEAYNRHIIAMTMKDELRKITR